MAESTLDSDAAMIDAITRPTMPRGKRQRHEVRQDLVGREIRRQRVELEVGEQRQADERQREHPDDVAGGVDDERPAARPRSDFVVCSRCTMI